MSLQPNVVGHKNMSITIALRVMVMLLLFSSCSGRKKEMGAAITERDSLPVMDTKGVTTLISDSGITRYRVNTAEWLIYDRKKPPYWAFEKGIYLEKFDSLFYTHPLIGIDTLFILIPIQQLRIEFFSFQVLYVYISYQLPQFFLIIVISCIGLDTGFSMEQRIEFFQIIYAIGFESNEQLTKYRFFKTEGIFYVDEDSVTPSDTLKTDSIK